MAVDTDLVVTEEIALLVGEGSFDEGLVAGSVGDVGADDSGFRFSKGSTFAFRSSTLNGLFGCASTLRSNEKCLTS